MVASADVRRLFLQAIFSRRILSQQLAAKIWEKCIAAVKGKLFKLHDTFLFDTHAYFVFFIEAVDPTLEIDYSNSKDAWNEWVNGLNRALDPLNLEFAHVTDELAGTDVYALVSTQFLP